MTLSDQLRSWADRIDLWRGIGLDPLPILAGSVASECVAEVLVLQPEGRWLSTLAVWADPSLGLYADPSGNMHESPCAVVRKMPAEDDGLAQFARWTERQKARGADIRRARLGLAVVTPCSASERIGER